MHHRRTNRNFNVVIPLADHLLGTVVKPGLADLREMLRLRSRDALDLLHDVPVYRLHGRLLPIVLLDESNFWSSMLQSHQLASRGVFM